jgi:hypothetical protein
MTVDVVYKNYQENYEDALCELADAPTGELLAIVGRDRFAYHSWFVKASEKVLAERAEKERTI